ncbi:ABC transporter substrate-binding protein [Undibacterium sp. Ren11W]|uniref:ABC transporter substrate-binding protein n=1 Tax=Undibacterium sp. Ren11W TaxID=3413045 RepID=UPI003BEF945D
MTLPFLRLLKHEGTTAPNSLCSKSDRHLSHKKNKRFSPKFALLAAVSMLALNTARELCAEEYFSHYASSTDSAAIDLGIQPLGYPSGVISALMQRDQILKKALSESQQELKIYPFKRGADMLTMLANQRLEAGFLGDMPTILSAASGDVWIVGLLKQSFTSIIAKDTSQVRDLVGKRLAYIEASSAHHTLLQGLASAGIREGQVSLVPLTVDAMPEALARGEIDAFAAWEPGPTLALSQSERNHIVFRGISSDYFVIGKEFAKQSPQAALHLVASLLRAVEWLRRSQRHLETAAKWAMADAKAFSGKATTLSVAQISAITRREILDIPSAPNILKNPSAPPLKAEFLFLANLGKLPATANEQNLAAAFNYDGLSTVISDRKKFQIERYDYRE